MVKLEILFKEDKKVELNLSDGKERIDQLIIGLDFNFDNLLVTSIDKLFKRNKIDKSSIKVVTVAPETDNGSVAYRTAQAVGEALKS